MMKRIFALLLCAATLLTSLALVGCSDEKDDKDKGQYITAYLSGDIYDLDPANAYNNDAVAKIVGMMFDTLFTLDDDGKVKKSLVSEYKIKEDKENNEYIMQLYINEKAAWSDGTKVSANDIVFAWQRLLRPENNYEAAALLFGIKNARLAKAGDCSIDDVGIFPAEQQMLEIQFEAPAEGESIDYDQFILNLTSLALAPLRDDIVSKSTDWAKKGSTMVCSGPFKLGRLNVTNGHPDDEMGRYFDNDLYLQENAPSDETETGFTVEADMNSYYGDEQRISDFILERNTYYYRNIEKDALDKSVTPYRICVDCSLSDAQLAEMYEKGLIMYINDIPMSLRKEGAIADAADVAAKSMSTATIYLNQNAEVSYGAGTEKLYANPAVRQALSMVIDRQAIADAVVYAEVATGLLPTGMFEAGNRKTTFRKACSETYTTLATNATAADDLLKSANLTAARADYEIELTVSAYNEVHCYIAEEIVKAWQALGFTKATVVKVGAITNNDFDKYTDSTPKDICDDLFSEDFRAGRIGATLVDMVAYSVDPFSVLAPFAKAFSGRGMDMSNLDHYELTPHITGYDDEDYNALMEDIFNTKKTADRASKFREAEKMLMEDMPVIPVIFNLDATVMNSNLKKVTLDYNGIADFRKANVKKYDEYLDAGFAYLEATYKPTNDAALLAGWKQIDSNATDDVTEMVLKFSEVSDNAKAVYSQHPMWNLKMLSSRGCSYTSWNLFRDASNSVYGHFFIKEKARLAALETEAAE